MPLQPDHIKVFDLPGAVPLPKPQITKGHEFIPDQSIDYQVLPCNEEAIVAVLQTMVMDPCHRAVHLEGPPGTGKTSITQYIAAKMGLPYYLVSCNGESDESDLLGLSKIGPLRSWQKSFGQMTRNELSQLLIEHARYRACDLQKMSDIDIRALCEREAMPVFSPGPLTEAFEHGGMIVLDECDMIDPEVLARLHSVLDNSGQLEVNGRIIKRHKDFYFVSTGNGDRFAGRKPATHAMSSRRTKVIFPAWKQPDYLKYLAQKYGNRVSPTVILKMTALHMALLKLDYDNPRGLAHEVGDLQFTPRNITKVLERYLAHVDPKHPLSNEELLAREVMEVYGGAIKHEEIRTKFRQLVEKGLAPLQNVDEFYNDLTFEVHPDRIIIGDVTLMKRTLSDPTRVPSGVDLNITLRVKRALYHLAKCRLHHEAALLVGERGMGKTDMIRLFNQLMGDNLYQQNLTNETDAFQLVGSYHSTGWVPGPFSQASDSQGEGGTYFLDEINFARNEVQVFMNAVLAGAKNIILTAKGGENWPIHPNFNVVAACNPANRNYAGTRKLDGSVMNRYTIHQVDQLDFAEFSEITTGIAKKYAERLLLEIPGLDRGAVESSYAKAATVVAQLQTIIEEAYQKHEIEDLPDQLKSFLPSSLMIELFEGLGEIRPQNRPQLSLRTIERVFDGMTKSIMAGSQPGQAFDQALHVQYVAGAPEPTGYSGERDQKNKSLLKAAIRKISGEKEYPIQPQNKGSVEVSSETPETQPMQNYFYNRPDLGTYGPSKPFSATKNKSKLKATVQNLPGNPENPIQPQNGGDSKRSSETPEMKAFLSMIDFSKSNNKKKLLDYLFHRVKYNAYIPEESFRQSFESHFQSLYDKAMIHTFQTGSLAYRRLMKWVFDRTKDGVEVREFKDIVRILDGASFSAVEDKIIFKESIQIDTPQINSLPEGARFQFLRINGVGSNVHSYYLPEGTDAYGIQFENVRIGGVPENLNLKTLFLHGTTEDLTDKAVLDEIKARAHEVID